MKILKITFGFSIPIRIGLAFGGMILVLLLQLTAESLQTLRPPIPAETPPYECVDLRPELGPY